MAGFRTKGKTEYRGKARRHARAVYHRRKPPVRYGRNILRKSDVSRQDFFRHQQVLYFQQNGGEVYEGDGVYSQEPFRRRHAVGKKYA